MRITAAEQAILLADNAWEKLLDYARNGLPSCYSNASDMMWDWWPDLPWDAVGSERAVTHLMSKPEPEFKLVMEKLGLNMGKEFKEFFRMRESNDY